MDEAGGGGINNFVVHQSALFLMQNFSDLTVQNPSK